VGVAGSPAVAAERIRQRDGQRPAARYLRGQELYFDACDPRAHATLLLD
jgi:hypothetical protein